MITVNPEWDLSQSENPETFHNLYNKINSCLLMMPLFSAQKLKKIFSNKLSN